ncbi:MAG: protein kinase [Salinivenus sp.]
MTGEQWDRVERLFEEARARPAGERASFLAASCDDPVVQREVASLLEMTDEAEALFDRLLPVAEERQRPPDAPGSGPPARDLLDLEGTQVGRYVVEEHLGGGGMGVVYRARDTELERPVALKFLPPHLATHPEAEKRFVREARAAAALDHANIATIHEIGETEEGRRFIAMAFYAGATLKETLSREGPLPVEEAVGYATQIAEGLARAHKAGIVHRDVKPANVMLTEADTVKIVDFGLARARGQSRLTEPGRRVGTAAYMSPEQAEGEAVDARTDLWALGVVLYEMLAGERPFKGDRETAVLYAILHEEPEPVGTHRPAVPPVLERITERCLRKDPDRRYASATALLDDLRTAGRDGSSASPSSPGADKESTDRSIAVLPFETLGTQETTAFTHGIHGDLLTRLSNVGGLQVISRTSVRTYRDTDKPLRRIARELGVKWMVEGEVQEVEEQVQVNARVVNARTDRQVWARDYRRDLTAENIFDIQGDLTEEIARSLKAELTPEEKRQVEHRPTENLAAYRLCAQGRQHLDQRTEDGIRRAFDCFQRAIEQDSEYALAWAGLTDALSLFAFYGFTPPEDASNPMDTARRAVDLDPKLGEARTSLGIQHAIRHEGPAALRELTRAVELAPSYAEAHIWLTWVSVCLGRPEMGLPPAKRAIELNPLAPAIRVYLAENYLANNNPDDALREARRAREIQPEYGLTHFMEGLVLHHQGRSVAAASSLQRAQSLVSPRGSPEYAEIQAALAVTHAAAGDAPQAREHLREIDEATAPFSAGLAQAALGNVDAAVAALERVDNWGSLETEHLRYFFPDVLGPLREDPCYKELLRSVNRSWGLNPDGTLPERTGMSQ